MRMFCLACGKFIEGDRYLAFIRKETFLSLFFFFNKNDFNQYLMYKHFLAVHKKQPQAV